SPASAAIAVLYDPINGNTTSFLLEHSAQVTLPATGTYLLAVAGRGTASGTVSYRFEAFQNADLTTALSLNSEVTGTLTNPGDEATFTFTGSIGQQIQFNGLEPGSTQAATLHDPEGNTVFNSFLANNTSPLTLTAPGLYKLVLTSSGSSTGN